MLLSIDEKLSYGCTTNYSLLQQAWFTLSDDEKKLVPWVTVCSSIIIPPPSVAKYYTDHYNRCRLKQEKPKD